MISVVIPTRNRRQALERCLEGLWKGREPKHGFEVVVVDDASSDDTETYLQQAAKKELRLRHLRQDRPHGPAAARNRGAELAGGEIVAFTDDDCVPSPNWLTAIEEGFATPSCRAMEGPVGPDGNDRPTPFSHYVQNARPGGFMSCNLAVRKTAFREIGGFDEDFQTSAHEDVDLCLNLTAIEKPIDFSSDMAIIHPPRKRRFWRESINAFSFMGKYAKGEMRLYAKHPQRYASVRHRATARSTLIHHALKYVWLQSRRPLARVLRSPLEFVILLTVNALRQLSLVLWTLRLLLFPASMKRPHTNK